MKNPKIQKQKTVVPQNEEVLLLKSQLVRALADYDNLRKRTEEEKVTWIKFATQKFLLNLLPVLDNFESAQNHIKDSGLAIAIGQLKDLIKQEGLSEIRPKEGDNFDENLHEAIDAIEDDEKAGKIFEMVTSGWKFMDGQVLVHAKVKVYKAAEKAS
ncbi:MAG TPA: nucleotide exchange factor GrpE [Candidatus Saccharimonadales bacterium]|nr:nucleotide exchange factor GrpE [Candidatus Saccharimonadales bacterium]